MSGKLNSRETPTFLLFWSHSVGLFSIMNSSAKCYYTVYKRHFFCNLQAHRGLLGPGRHL